MLPATPRILLEDLEVSSIGLGTYLGMCDAATDAQLLAVLRRGRELGVNFIDTAANYRGGRSERVIGKFIRELSIPEADRFVIATKAGILPYDPERAVGISDETYFTQTFLATGVVRREWVCGDWQCYHPRYLEWQLEQSLAALGRSRIDIFYLHNPEGALLTTTRAEFEAIMRQAFRWLGAMVKSGIIRYFGVASWGGLLGLSESEALDLSALTAWARDEQAGDAFRFLEVPVSAAMPQAFLKRSQGPDGSRAMSLVNCAAYLGKHVIASAPLLNGRLLDIPCPPELQEAVGLTEPAQAYLEFARSAPGVAAALVGTLSVAHIEQAAQLLERSPVRLDLVRFLKLETRI
jgi:aryl-alcohol dehydrogenase-like predicted oxidoreductase